MTIKCFSDIHWSRDPANEEEAILRRAFLNELAETESRFAGPAFGLLALRELASRYDVVAGDLCEAITQWECRVAAFRELRQKKEYDETFMRVLRVHNG